MSAARSSQHHIYTVLSIGGMLALWWIVTAAELVNPYFVPSPAQVVEAAKVLFLEASFFADLGVSTARIFGAFMVAAVLAIPIGIAMSVFPIVGTVISPIIDFVRYVPVPALVPLFVMFGGIGETSKFLVLFFGTFFQLVLIIADDANQAPRSLFELAQTMGASKYQQVRDILLPWQKPLIYDRLRITLGWCWTYLVIAELVAANRGVGHVIKEAQRFNAVDRLFVCLITLGLVGLVIDQSMRALAPRLFPYRKA